MIFRAKYLLYFVLPIIISLLIGALVITLILSFGTVPTLFAITGMSLAAQALIFGASAAGVALILSGIICFFIPRMKAHIIAFRELDRALAWKLDEGEEIDEEHYKQIIATSDDKLEVAAAIVMLCNAKNYKHIDQYKLGTDDYMRVCIFRGVVIRDQNAYQNAYTMCSSCEDVDLSILARDALEIFVKYGKGNGTIAHDNRDFCAIETARGVIAAKAAKKEQEIPKQNPLQPQTSPATSQWASAGEKIYGFAAGAVDAVKRLPSYFGGASDKSRLLTELAGSSPDSDEKEFLDSNNK